MWLALTLNEKWLYRVIFLTQTFEWIAASPGTSTLFTILASTTDSFSFNTTAYTSLTHNMTETTVDPGVVASPVAGVGFFHAFVASFSVIIVSELGDKTFFIAAIMAMRHPRLTVFAGAIAALAAMTVLSVGFGWLTTYIPRSYTYYISTLLFALFGLKMLRDGYYMSPNEGQEELEEVQSDLRRKDEELEKESMMEDMEGGGRRTGGSKRNSALGALSRVFLQAFTLTFIAEWGDRSQLTTIILAAREDLYGVTMGGVIGHSICTGLAVIGGRMIAQKISVRTVTIIGGIVFLIFAVTSLFTNPGDETVATLQEKTNSL